MVLFDLTRDALSAMNKQKSPDYSGLFVFASLPSGMPLDIGLFSTVSDGLVTDINLDEGFTVPSNVYRYARRASPSAREDNGSSLSLS